ncbi:hypothetical protein TVAG_224310 [Trichomonas vaginalis G3]|uniref:Uncharacterized protein n=1 Tax=Trichomonas vaginalis (strain ATCC PRA-98 / G3) TaxID=412133 RepID=A2DW54_TRIV3|nr:bifunctional inhibitor/lipid-transfer protein/seed storage 2s albumin superfamily protein family [Trichomonas vaginalis G3]EAY15355.1 hypothetical protein TVAG_224310 [Trichomonas vaginalis G3]KAI5496779.1 bifunctional inhibitor/lipid-transfer protein/seed storage 2s albumin superfamily protein family [Trichomonas vaginalis G3]|eukprot:XP_001327578.1 hypothetical protein [Trichomonas vaginalis G3]
MFSFLTIARAHEEEERDFTNIFSSSYTNLRDNYYFSNCVFENIGTSTSSSSISLTNGTSSYYIDLFRCSFIGCIAQSGGSVTITGSNDVSYNLNMKFICLYHCSATTEAGIWLLEIWSEFNLSYCSMVSCSSRYRTSYIRDGNGPIVSNWNSTDITADTKGDWNDISQGAFYFHCGTDYSIKYCNFEKCNSRDSLIHSWWSEGNCYITRCNFVGNNVSWFAIIFLNFSHTAKITIDYCNFLDNIFEKNVFKCTRLTYFTDSARIDIGTLVANNMNTNTYVVAGYVSGYPTIVGSTWKTEKITFFETLQCKAKIKYPEKSPIETPFNSPNKTPLETLYLTPHETPNITPFETNGFTPYTTPISTPYSTVENTVIETPRQTPIETQFSTPSDTIFDTPCETQFMTPYDTFSYTMYDTPLDTFSLTPFSTVISTPFQTLIFTLVETPVPTIDKTPSTTPLSSLDSTPFYTDKETAEMTPFNTEMETIFITPIAAVSSTQLDTPFETLYQTPTITPSETLPMTPILTQKETIFMTPFFTLSKTQIPTLEETEHETPFNTPHLTGYYYCRLAVLDDNANFQIIGFLAR